MTAYYNEIDPYGAEWLRNLIAEGFIAPGDVDERSIVDVRPGDLQGYAQCHFFAGIAGWSLALRLAGWPDDRPVWTGSCPCQPFSAAGKGKASGDERHLWPEWFRLIRAVRPPVIFGEQVEAAIGWGWLDLVHTDLEAEGYTIRAAVLPACSVGAPHIRQRLWFVADRDNQSAIARSCAEGNRSEGRSNHLNACEPSGELADSASNRSRDAQSERIGRATEFAETHSNEGELAAALPAGRPEGRAGTRDGQTASGGSASVLQGPEGETRDEARLRVSSHGCWQDLIWLPCTDGKQRPTQPGIFPLAHGVPARVAKLRALGNAIVPQVAAQFIRAFGECQP